VSLAGLFRSSPGGRGGPSEGWWRGIIHGLYRSRIIPLHRFAVPLPLRGRNLGQHDLAQDRFEYRHAGGGNAETRAFAGDQAEGFDLRQRMKVERGVAA